MRFRYFIAKGRFQVGDRTLYPNDEVPADCVWGTIDRDVSEGRVRAVPVLEPESPVPAIEPPPTPEPAPPANSRRDRQGRR